MFRSYAGAKIAEGGSVCKIYDGATIAKGGGVFMFKIYDGTKINKGGCLRCIMNRNNQKEGLCVRYVMNRKRQSPKEGACLKDMMEPRSPGGVLKRNRQRRVCVQNM